MLLISHEAISKTGDVTDGILDFLQLYFEAFKVFIFSLKCFFEHYLCPEEQFKNEKQAFRASIAATGDCILPWLLCSSISSKHKDLIMQALLEWQRLTQGFPAWWTSSFIYLTLCYICYKHFLLPCIMNF